jgi:hypothetical protein
MSQTIKKRNLSILLILFALTMLFVNCQFDDKESFHINNYNHSTYKVQKLKKEQYVKNSKLVNRLNKFESKFAKKSNSKIVSANDNSFSIDTDFTFFIEKENGKHSYTFLINRPNSAFQLENLILNSNDSLGYDIYLAQYDITALEYEQIMIGQNPNVLNKTIITKLNSDVIDLNSIFSRSTVDPETGMCGKWITIEGNVCPSGHHRFGQECNFVSQYGFVLYPDVTIYDWRPCSYDDIAGSSGDPSGGSTGGSPGGGGDGSDGSTTDNPTGQDKDDSVITTPVTSTNNKLTPCEHLSKMLVNEHTYNALNGLKNKTGLDSENGYSVKKDPQAGRLDALPAFPSSSDLNKIYMKTGGKFIGAFHTHPLAAISKEIPMFSDGDINWLYWVAFSNDTPRNEKDFSEFFLTLTVPQGTFAIKIKDWAKFSTFRNNKNLWSAFNNGQKAQLKQLNDKYDRIGYNGSFNKMKNALLEIFRDYDVGLGLYEANEDLTSWSELELGIGASSYNEIDQIKKTCN